ncbi:LPXTG cell wall anchor domain-containing protein [Enterococcus wangshanyuanii]|uniref:Gram-positive cocci surface proteins LPxTG domain-containing protein n=1 Tax=Enterococcus wangshanyuanii TaxID=2005703 RepID=A0ABQ1PSY8_9ENTE|nr:LPXTG cell wall anchor domain-containing protein [Enterococcus wangshanyuanii]GGD02946.1 hypothetical protein GCM10011573_35520 [Enterococcus wangshanyuanii]
MKQEPKRNIIKLLFSIAVCLLVIPQIAQAEGGQLGHQGGITFYDEETTPSSTSPTEPMNPSSPSSPSKEVSEKPVGRIPNMGEIAKQSMLLSGIVLIVGVSIYFVYRRRKKQ